MKKKIVIATRKSELAMWQARHAEALLRDLHADYAQTLEGL